MRKIVEEYFLSVKEAFNHGNIETNYNAPIMKMFEKIGCQVRDLSGSRKGKKGENIDLLLWHQDSIINENEPFAGIEVKKIGGKPSSQDQIELEVRKFENIIYTDNCRWEFYNKGNPNMYSGLILINVDENNELILQEDKIDLFITQLEDFILQDPVNIKSSDKLAKYMSIHARTIRDNVKGILKNNGSDQPLINERQKKLPMFPQLYGLYLKIKQDLNSGINVNTFADMYAQTIVYGLFIARYNDDTLETFDKYEAIGNLQQESLLLKQFFTHIANDNVNPAISNVVDKLCTLYKLTDISKILDQNESQDTIIHFYEDFLTYYNPELRKKLGVFYTPWQAVRYMIREVDYILNKDFNLNNGLANKEYYDIDVASEEYEISRGKTSNKRKIQVPRVAVLDPSTGTGTFISEIIKYVKETYFSGGNEIFYNNYITHPENLVSRLIGFEIMMTSYVIAHLKIKRTIHETLNNINYKNLDASIFLTDTLADPNFKKERNNQIGIFEDFSSAMTNETYFADTWKLRRPIKVIIGNPPYLASSTNPFDISEYKYETDGKTKLKERNPKWLNDDYVKFIRFSEDLIQKNENGVLAFITNNGYLDNPTFRGMRASLLRTFDKIKIINLHGNSLKKEISPDGSKDENIFDITVGISIIIAVKITSSEKWASVKYADIWGLRQNKLNSLANGEINFKDIYPDKGMALLIDRNIDNESEYIKGINVVELFKEKSTGITTGRDKLFINKNKNKLIENLNLFKLEGEGKIFNKVKEEYIDNFKIKLISYRPFDERFIYYEPNILERARAKTMEHLKNDNLGLVFRKQQPDSYIFNSVFVTKNLMADGFIRSDNKGGEYIAPLFLYKDGQKIANFDENTYNKLVNNLVRKPNPNQVLGYCYSILNHKGYIDKYDSLLIREFPRIPIPMDDENFYELSNLGQQLINLHTMDVNKNSNLKIIQFNEDTAIDLTISNISFKTELLYINKTTAIKGISQEVWNYRIGTYKVIEKWFKSHKNYELSLELFGIIQKIVYIITESIEIKTNISNFDFES